MSILEEAAAAVTPMESDQDRADARAKARESAKPGDWFSMILDHHVQIEDAFRDAKSAEGGDAARAALKKLGVVVMGHAIAEEAVIYPAMAETGQSGHSDHGYDEQATVKVDMAELEKMDPSSGEFADKLEAIREAVAHLVSVTGTGCPRSRPADAHPEISRAVRALCRWRSRGRRARDELLGGSGEKRRAVIDTSVSK